MHCMVHGFGKRYHERCLFLRCAHVARKNKFTRISNSFSPQIISCELEVFIDTKHFIITENRNFKNRRKTMSFDSCYIFNEKTLTRCWEGSWRLHALDIPGLSSGFSKYLHTKQNMNMKVCYFVFNLRFFFICLWGM